MKCNSLDGKNIDLGDIKVDYGEMALPTMHINLPTNLRKLKSTRVY